MSFLRRGRYTHTLAERDAFNARDADFSVVRDAPNRGLYVFDGTNWVPAGQNALTRIPLDDDVQGLWDLRWNSGTELPGLTDRSANGYDLNTITGTVMYGQVGSLTGARFADGSGDNISGPTGQTNLEITGDCTMELLMSWDGDGSNSAAIAGFGGVGETEVENQLYAITNGSADRGLRWFHEFGAGSNTTPLLPKAEPPKGSPYLLTVVRDATAKNIRAYYDGNLAETSTYTSNATGGGNGFMTICGGAVTDVTIAGLCVSDIARSAANVLLRAQQVGTAR